MKKKRDMRKLFALRICIERDTDIFTRGDERYEARAGECPCKPYRVGHLTRYYATEYAVKKYGKRVQQ